jgi:hypothetical protein
MHKVAMLWTDENGVTHPNGYLMVCDRCFPLAIAHWEKIHVEYEF